MAKEPKRIWIEHEGRKLAYKRDTSMKMPSPGKPVLLDMRKGPDGVWRVPNEVA